MAVARCSGGSRRCWLVRGRRADPEPRGRIDPLRDVGLDSFLAEYRETRPGRAHRSRVTSRLFLLGTVVLTIGACGSDGSKCCSPSTGSATAICQGLQTSFFAALPAARSCATGSVGQCQKTLPLPVVGCPSPICLVAVNDDSALMPIETQWNLLGCSQLPGYGCAQGCRQATTGVCTAQDGGSICDP